MTKKYQSKYGDVVTFYSAIIFFEVFFLCVAILIMFLGLSTEEGVFWVFSMIPWQVYTVVGSIFASLYIFCVIGYFSSKKICTIDENEIIFMDGEREVKIAKEDIQLIFRERVPFWVSILALFAYECCDYFSTTFLKNDRTSMDFSIFPGSFRKLKKLGYPVAKIKPFKKVSKKYIHYFVGEESVAIEYFRVERVYLNYIGDGLRIDVEFLRGDGNLHRETFANSFRSAEALIKKLPKEKFELNFFSAPSTGRAKKHYSFLLGKGLITKEEYEKLGEMK